MDRKSGLKRLEEESRDESRKIREVIQKAQQQKAPSVRKDVPRPLQAERPLREYVLLVKKEFIEPIEKMARARKA